MTSATASGARGQQPSRYPSRGREVPRNASGSGRTFTVATRCSSRRSARRSSPDRIGSVGRLSASILAADFARLGEQVKLIEPWAETIHVDIMDGRFVPPLTIGPVVVASLRKVTDRTLHGH